MNNFVYEYWSRTELGKAMIKSNNVSYSDLLFLIPNNIKKMHGLPLTRMSGKKRRKRKKQRKQRITSFYLFDIIEGIIDKELCSKQLDEAFNKFVSIKDVSYGDDVYRDSIEALPCFNEPVKLYNHLTSNVNPYPLAGWNFEIKLKNKNSEGNL